MKKSLVTATALPRLALLLVLGAVVLVYAPGLHAPFYLDDWAYIVTNPSIHMDRFGLEALYRAGADFPHQGRPVVAMSLAIDYYLYGLDPAGFRTVNIAIHMLNGILVYGLVALTLRTPVLIGRIPQPEWLALAVAFLWLLHPLQIQSVTYVWQRTNALAGLFYLLAFIGYVKGRLTISQPKRILYWAGAGLSWLVALGSKELAAPLPLFVLLYEWFFFQDLSRDWLRRGLPWVIVGLILSAALVLNFLGTNPIAELERGYASRDFDPIERVITEWRVVIFYLGLLALPHPDRLSMEHDFSISESLLVPPTTLGAGLLLFAIVVFAVVSARQSRLLAFTIFWFLGHLVIESTVIPLELAFEYRAYLPSIGPILAVVLLLWRLPLSLGLKAITIFGLGLLLGLWTQERNQLWAQEIAFWEDTVAKAPTHSRTHASLGFALQRAGRTADAEAAYSQVIWMFERELDRPIRAGKNAIHAYLRRAELRLDRGDIAGAQEDLQALVRLNPRSSAKPMLAILIGTLLQRADLREMAVQQYSWVIKRYEYASRARAELHNQVIVAYNNRGAIRLTQGDLQGAMQDAERALRLNPQFETARNLKRAVQLRLDEAKRTEGRP